MKAREHLEHIEKRVSNGKPCPNARKLIKELGGMVEDQDSTRTLETCYTHILGML